MGRGLVVLAGCAAVLLGAAPAAGASKRQESIFMDDPQIVYAAPDRLEGTLAEIKRLGADRIRVSVFWSLLAPDPKNDTEPFAPGAGADPHNYSAEKWDRYDRIVTTAQALGLKVLFNVTSPAPYWATGTPPREDINDTYRPSPAEFRDFVKAVGTRYSGTFQDEESRQTAASALGACDPTPDIPRPPPVCPLYGEDPSPSNPNPPNTGPVLPRVDTWSMWNEPNMPGWLTPQSNENDKNLPASPQVYRDLADAMYTGLQQSGHGGDTILLGETAPRGATRRSVTQSLPPLLFIRELYCLNGRLEPYTGGAAEKRGCPSGGGGFADAHPALFNATAFGHHPYAFEAPPERSDPTNDDAVIADLERLELTLDSALGRYGVHRKMPIWLTEYGYQTDPPDPFVGWPWRAQTRFLAQAEWMAYRDPRVDSTAQFLLYDDAPLEEFATNDPRHWGTFQTGLRTVDGTKKGAYRGYQRTVNAPARARRGHRIAIFGDYRPAEAPFDARVEFRRRGRKTWKTVATGTTSARGFIVVKVRAMRSGAYRIGFEAGTRTIYTRAASVTVKS